MQINKIIKMKNNKYKIIIDGEPIITYDNVILENDLLYKKNIDNKILKKIIIDTNYYDIYNKTIKYILKRRRSEKEIVKYLDKFDIGNNDKNKMINKFKEINLINDKEYCKAYINDKLYLSKDGINKIKSDLLKENISIDVIDQELKNIDKDIFNDRLEKLIIKKIKSNKKYSNNYLKQKILTDMINLGYSKEIILKILENNIESDTDVLRKEFDRIYNKLKIKYNGIELENKVKQKLLQKGFNISDINILLQEKTED
ncbi:MAG: RecX family transcriptional regulator [Bacilli bacterium]|nr:RecX family transcriptional regulator [Bacilli bacterium]